MAEKKKKKIPGDGGSPPHPCHLPQWGGHRDAISISQGIPVQISMAKTAKLFLESHTFSSIPTFFFFFFAFQGRTSGLWRFPGEGSNHSCSCRPTPQPQQRQVQASSVNYTTAHGKAGSLTRQARPGIEPSTSWFLVGFASAVPQAELFYPNICL